MLISHRKNFIFTKTVKTAGTSVECYFERYCMPEGTWKKSHSREVYISNTGIIGYRGKFNTGKKYYNHMSAKMIRDTIGKDIWDRYFKFTIVRNPYDKVISAYYFHRLREYLKENKAQKLISYTRNILNIGGAIDSIQKKQVIESFRLWIKNGGLELVDDRNKYIIDGQVCVDYFIRYETLHDSINYICDQLSIPFIPSEIPKYKTGVRKHIIPIADYYDEETKEIVFEQFDWEFDHFGYVLPKVK